jgi:hypothetical protein
MMNMLTMNDFNVLDFMWFVAYGITGLMSVSFLPLEKDLKKGIFPSSRPWPSSPS